MKFGPVQPRQAEGAFLAHALKLGDVRMKKGRVLSASDIQNIVASGIETVIVARLEDSDVAEDQAALRISELIAHDSIKAADPFTGRVNFYAAHTGIFQVDRHLIDKVNRISPSITLATLEQGSFVEQGRMVATIKIIPFAVPGALLEQVEAVVAKEAVLQIVASRAQKVGLVATCLPSLKLSVMDKTARVLADRLSPSGSSIVAEMRVAHEQSALRDAIATLIADCDLVVVFGASAITDEDDVIPAAIRLSGGTVDHFGMPVDPGNLLLVGSVQGKPVIGAPGCARSPAENGFDWILQRLIAGLPVDSAYITGLGVGGLLMEITARPQPREG